MLGNGAELMKSCVGFERGLTVIAPDDDAKPGPVAVSVLNIDGSSLVCGPASGRR